MIELPREFSSAPPLSVAMSVYNGERFLAAAVDSVLAQTFREFEFLILDDGSTDDTPAILAEYASRHSFIQVVTKPDRGHRAVGPGVVEAFYHGLDQVDADAYPYLCKLDLDLDLRWVSFLLGGLAAPW